MARIPGINAELTAAIRRVADAYGRLPEPQRPNVNAERWHALEREIDQACMRGNQDSALAAVERWERHALTELAATTEGQS